MPKLEQENPKNSTNPKKLMKRKRRQSEGSAKLAQHLERVEATSSRTLAMIDSVTSSSVNQRDADEDHIVQGLCMLDKMADEGYFPPASAMWCFAAEKITDDKSRVLFLNMRVGERFQRSGDTISRAINDVLRAICGRSGGHAGLARDMIRPIDPNFSDVPSKLQNDA